MAWPIIAAFAAQGAASIMGGIMGGSAMRSQAKAIQAQSNAAANYEVLASEINAEAIEADAMLSWWEAERMENQKAYQLYNQRRVNKITEGIRVATMGANGLKGGTQARIATQQKQNEDFALEVLDQQWTESINLKRYQYHRGNYEAYTTRVAGQNKASVTAYSGAVQASGLRQQAKNSVIGGFLGAGASAAQGAAANYQYENPKGG